MNLTPRVLNILTWFILHPSSTESLKLLVSLSFHNPLFILLYHSGLPAYLQVSLMPTLTHTNKKLLTLIQNLWNHVLLRLWHFWISHHVAFGCTLLTWPTYIRKYYMKDLPIILPTMFPCTSIWAFDFVQFWRGFTQL